MLGVAPVAGLTPAPPPAGPPQSLGQTVAGTGPLPHPTGSPPAVDAGRTGHSVNPLGGTVAADPRGFPGPSRPPSGGASYGSAPPQPPAGSPWTAGGSAPPFTSYGQSAVRHPYAPPSPQGSPYGAAAHDHPYGDRSGLVAQPGLGPPQDGTGMNMAYPPPATGLGVVPGSRPSTALPALVLPIVLTFGGGILTLLLWILSGAVLGVAAALVTLTGAVVWWVLAQRRPKLLP